MKNKTVVVLFLLVFNIFYTQTVNPQKINQEISALNDRLQYKKSLSILDKILDNPDATHYDKFIAYLQKYYTYKRVSDYTAALENLDKAKKEGALSNKKDEAFTKTTVEDFFCKIDLQAFDEAKKKLEESKGKISLSLLDSDTRGFFYTAVAILNLMDHQFAEANKNLDTAVEIFQKRNPKHLANIYRKKLDVARAMGNEPLMLENYKKGLYYAKKYKVEVYEKNLYESLIDYYREQHKPKLEKYYHDLSINTAINNYKDAEWRSDLKKSEQKREDEKKQKAAQKQQTTIAFFSIITILLIVLAVYFYKAYKTNKKARILVEEENNRILQELQQALQQSSTNNIINDKKGELSQRQLQVIELLQQEKTNKEIANELYISENTVKYHLKIIYNVLEIKHRSELVNS